MKIFWMILDLKTRERDLLNTIFKLNKREHDIYDFIIKKDEFDQNMIKKDD